MATNAAAPSLFGSHEFSLWEFALFGLTFGVLGGLLVWNAFAATSPVQTFVSTSQGAGYVEFSASTKESYTPNGLVVTNSCYNDSSKLINSQTAPLTRWIDDKNAGHVGYVRFTVPSKMRCLAYVHKDNNTKSLADFNYTSQ